MKRFEVSGHGSREGIEGDFLAALRIPCFSADFQQRFIGVHKLYHGTGLCCVSRVGVAGADVLVCSEHSPGLLAEFISDHLVVSLHSLDVFFILGLLVEHPGLTESHGDIHPVVE